MSLSFYVHVVLPYVSVIDYRESVCLGGVWSKAVVDVKTEGDFCGCVASPSLLFWFALQGFLFAWAGFFALIFLWR